MQRWTIRIALTLLAFCALAYAVDWIRLQLRERRGSAYGSVMVDNSEVVKDKGGKVEYFDNGPQPTPCVHSLFPHDAEPACWWLARHSDQTQSVN
ncbi:MAG: hypothetical protein WA532_15110 [Candidatus Korobacteraceae bacterium]